VSAEKFLVSKRDRLLVLAVVLLAIVGTILIGAIALRAADASAVQLNVSRSAPREVEEQTQKGVLRDYVAAWKAYATALTNSSPAALGDLWTGFAREQILDAIEAQRRSGLSVRFTDTSHQLDAVFYSPEGSALELYDTAQLERQVLDGSSAIQTENVTARYLVVMTPSADHWQVRILQPAPSF
jgi:hypothetical protein